MRMVELYHGGELPVLVPRVVSPRANRPLDFGSGFYATTSLDQAKRWVAIRIRQRVYSRGFVSRFLFDAESAARLDVLRFNGQGEEWLDFVMANRHEMNFHHDHDIVWGPVANDNVYETLTLFEDGIIGKAEAIVRLKTYKLVDQILFHSEASLSLLRYIDAMECPQ